MSLLSFPPDAKYLSSNDHFKPTISYLWDSNRDMNGPFSLKSLFKIDLSLEPDDNMFALFHDKAPTLPLWPSNERTSF